MSPKFQSLVSYRGAILGPMLLLTIDSKPCMESLMAPPHLTLSHIESLKSRSIKFQRFIFRKGAELGYMLLIKQQ